MIEKKKIVFYGDSITEGFPGESYVRIMQKALPEHEFINLGKGGDTVVSLYRRIVKKNLAVPTDIAILWVGVNDILVKTSKVFPLLKLLRRQPWAGNQKTFIKYYRRILNILNRSSKKVLAVSPLFIGEDPHSRWNGKLDALSEIIKNLTNSYSGTTFIDLKDTFNPLLPKENAAQYKPNRMLFVILNAMFHRTTKSADNTEASGDFRFTIDGVHLSKKGVELVAKVVLENIKPDSF
jgi:lysophospholipase L1-like esterase